ncbi:50S ribosomal protein L10 [Chloroflexota bacterium]
MAKEKNEETIKRVENLLADCKIAIVTDYRGMTVAEMSDIRQRLRNSNTEYHVVKNTLTSLAADRTGREELKAFLTQPSAIAFGYGEVVDSAKIMIEYIRSSKVPLKIKGGVLDQRALSAEEVTTLASLPPAPILISQLMQQLQAPISSLLFVISANLRGLVGVLEARKQQLEGG